MSGQVDGDEVRIRIRYVQHQTGVADHRHLMSPPMQPHRHDNHRKPIAANRRDRHGKHPYQAAAAALVARM